MEMGMIIIGADAFNPTTVLKLINKERSKQRLRPLTLHGALSKAAQFQVNYCARFNKLTHSNPAGPIGTRLLRFKYTWSTAGENLASGFSVGYKNGYWCADFATLLK
ncbi:6551_t:CDS:2 [Diversispora eburnea]|uniref:6551_t:CDS:1 n=1 Tax=Diversispora eburnea TaxID=1213867 RepID=A0A9N8V1K2_9GLOM|nr:6551_t:CDS:2 [Diversispora eburnea]